MTARSDEFRLPWPPTTPAIRNELQSLLDEQTWGVYEGRRCEQLGHQLAETFLQEFVYLCCSGTLAVELGLRGLGVGPGDEVILAGYDFPGNFRAVEAVGARPVLVDLSSDSWTIDIAALRDAASSETKAVVASHLHGTLVDMPRLMAMANELGLEVLEDACQAPGARIDGRPAGCWGDVSVLSFGGSKLLSAGRGGAVLTRREDVLQRIKVFGERGNLAFPLSELQAAVLLSQLDELTARHAQRLESAKRVMAELGEFADVAKFGGWTEDQSPAFYKLAFGLSDRFSRDEALEIFRRSELPIDAGFRGFTRRSGRRCRRIGDLAQAQRASDATLLIHHPVLLGDEELMSRLIDRLRECFQRLRDTSGGRE